jgi:hypothetical protein
MTAQTVYEETEAPMCECGSEKFWRECWDCGGEAYTHHDCGEDCCCCLDPEDNVLCETCEGACGWYQCSQCHPWED